MGSDPWYFSGGIQYGPLTENDDPSTWTKLVIEAFAYDLWKGVAAGFGNEVVDFANQITVDLTTIGLNGRDAGTPGTPPDGCYKVWPIADPTGAQPPGAIVTQTLDIRNIVFPPGYSRVNGSQEIYVETSATSGSPIFQLIWEGFSATEVS